MSDSKLPTEVELVYEVMPCNAMRTIQEPLPPGTHACAYFRQWGTYHSFDYTIDGVPDERNIPLKVKYVGRLALIPEILSGCRKSPIMAVGINPNLPGWFPNKRGALNPSFDNYKQYAHYFRYRSTYKLLISNDDYIKYGGGDDDNPLISKIELNIPANANGDRVVTAEVDNQTMYSGYLNLLNDLATEMNWERRELKLEEDFVYMNMVACPSARWRTTQDPKDPDLPPMTINQRDGIINECFKERKHFLRQLFQSLPKVIIVFSQTTAAPFIREMQSNFTLGKPQVGESVEDLLDRHIRLSYGRLEDGTVLDARVIFSPHISGDRERYQRLRTRVLEQLIDEAKAGRLTFNEDSGHLHRSRGACSFCPMLEIGPCPYTTELQPLNFLPGFLADAPSPMDVLEEKRTQAKLLQQLALNSEESNATWEDEPDGFQRL